MKILIALLCGGLVKDSVGKWYSPTFEEGIALYGAPGSRERVVATSFLWKENPDAMVAVLGGKGQMKNIHDAPTLAEAISRELAELGVPREKIIEEKESGTTYQQLLAFQKITENYLPEKIIIVSNRYHLPRVETMVDYVSKLSKLKKFKLFFKEAEKILIKHDSNRWEAQIKKAYKSKEMGELIAKEKHGEKQVIEGTYDFF